MAISNALPSGIKSIQQGITQLPSGSPNGSIGITTVNPDKAVIEITGFSTSATTSPSDGNPCVAIISANVVNWKKQSSGTAGWFSWRITEYF